MKFSSVKIYYRFFLFVLFISTFLIVLLYKTIPSFSITQCQRDPPEYMGFGNAYRPSEGWDKRGCYCVTRTDRQTWKRGYSSTSYQCPNIPGSSGNDTDDDDSTDDNGIPYDTKCNPWEQKAQLNFCTQQKRYVCKNSIHPPLNLLITQVVGEDGWDSKGFCPTDVEVSQCKTDKFFSFTFDNEWHCYDFIERCVSIDNFGYKRYWDNSKNTYAPTSMFCKDGSYGESAPFSPPNDNDDDDDDDDDSSQQCPRVKVRINTFPYKTGIVKLKCNNN